MKRKLFVYSIAALTILGLVPGFASAKETRKPNIVFILADDLGYAELGCYGQQKIKTPHIDQLAADGMKFSQHYTGAPVCAPARCVLMTGKHLAHAEIRGNRDSGNGEKYPGQWPITDEAVTIAEMMKTAGYATGAFGKWGLGPTQSTGAPNKQGFDRFYGFICQRNAHSFYPPFLDSDDKEVTINKNPIRGHQKKPEGEVDADDYRDENYAPDLVLEEALKFIDRNKKKKPFFLYLPFIEPHVAMQPPQEWVDRYPKEWDTKPYRGDRGYLPHPRPNAGYAAMISDLDEHVGAIMARLKKYGLDKNTIVVFTSDNGATHNVGGVTTEFFDSMGGLRGKKGSCYEGGIRMPCIVRWPGRVEAGSSTDAASYFPDWFPTFCQIAGVELPEEQLDGVSLVDVLAGGELPKRHELMMWEFYDYAGGIIAIRDGDWKAVRRGLRHDKPKNWELYNIATDREEKKNVAAQYPEKIQRMEKAWLESRTVEPEFPIPMVDNGLKPAAPSVNLKSGKMKPEKVHEGGALSVNFMSGNKNPEKVYGSSTGVIDQGPSQWVNFDTSSSLTASNVSGTSVNVTVSKVAAPSATAADAAPKFPDGTDSFLALYSAGLRDVSPAKGDTYVTISDMTAYLKAKGATFYRIIAYYKSGVTASPDTIALGLATGSLTKVDPDGDKISVKDSFVEAGNPESNYIIFDGLTADSTTVYLNRVQRDGVLMGIQIQAISE